MNLFFVLALALSGSAFATIDETGGLVLPSLSEDAPSADVVQDSKPGVGLRLLPEGRPFQLTFPDPREIRMGLTFEGDSKLVALIGNYFSILSLEPPDTEEGTEPDWTMHFGLEGAGYFSMRSADGRFPLETTDGLIGVYIEGKSGIFQWQTRFTHISAHLSDGLPGVPIAYSRETVSLRGGVAPNERSHAYAGVSYLAHTVPDLKPWGLQVGGSYFLPWGIAAMNPFVGFDLKWKEESAVNPSFALQIGVGINNPPEAYRSFRFFYSYYTGADPRGQMLNSTVTSHAFGIEMQI